jgi:hypothetical protein
MRTTPNVRRGIAPVEQGQLPAAERVSGGIPVQDLRRRRQLLDHMIEVDELMEAIAKLR